MSAIDERNLALQNIYKCILKSNVNRNLMNNDMIISIVMEQPAPKFYISPKEAKKLILSYYKSNGELPIRKKSLTREMAKDLVENYEMLRKKFPHTDKERIYEYVVEQPAKSFYMSYNSVRAVIFNYKGRTKRRL